MVAWANVHGEHALIGAKTGHCNLIRARVRDLRFSLVKPLLSNLNTATTNVDKPCRVFDGGAEAEQVRAHVDDHKQGRVL